MSTTHVRQRRKRLDRAHPLVFAAGGSSRSGPRPSGRSGSMTPSSPIAIRCIWPTGTVWWPTSAIGRSWGSPAWHGSSSVPRFFASRHLSRIGDAGLRRRVLARAGRRHSASPPHAGDGRSRPSTCRCCGDHGQSDHRVPHLPRSRDDARHPDGDDPHVVGDTQLALDRGHRVRPGRRNSAGSGCRRGPDLGCPRPNRNGQASGDPGRRRRGDRLVHLSGRCLALFRVASSQHGGSEGRGRTGRSDLRDRISRDA